MTIHNIIRRALRKIGVAAADEDMTADQAEDGLARINDMLHGWALFGVDLGHSDLALTDEFPLPARFREGTILQLAERLSQDHAVPAASADLFFRAIQTAYMTIPPANIPSALMRTSSQRRFRGA